MKLFKLSTQIPSDRTTIAYFEINETDEGPLVDFEIAFVRYEYIEKDEEYNKDAVFFDKDFGLSLYNEPYFVLTFNGNAVLPNSNILWCSLEDLEKLFANAE